MPATPLLSPRTANDTAGGYNITQAALELQASIPPSCASNSDCSAFVNAVVPQCLSPSFNAFCWCYSSYPPNCAKCIESSDNSTASSLAQAAQSNFELGCQAFEADPKGVPDLNHPQGKSLSNLYDWKSSPKGAVAGMVVGVLVAVILGIIGIIAGRRWWQIRRDRADERKRNPNGVGPMPSQAMAPSDGKPSLPSMMKSKFNFSSSKLSTASAQSTVESEPSLPPFPDTPPGLGTTNWDRANPTQPTFVISDHSESPEKHV